MDIKTLEYFLTVAHEESISRAANSLHMTQPPLTRQMKELEAELGKTLLIRGKRKVTLTQEGMQLRKRAQEIVELTQRARSEISAMDTSVSGDIYIGCAEMEAIRIIAKAVLRMRKASPKICVHIISSRSDEVIDLMDRGLMDMGVFANPTNLARYDFIALPHHSIWGAIMRRDHPLAQLERIKPEDLIGVPLIVSNQSQADSKIGGWFKDVYSRLEIVATYNLLYNAGIFAQENVGVILGYKEILPTNECSPLCFRPLEPELDAEAVLAWKKGQMFSPPIREFIKAIDDEMNRVKNEI